MKGCTSPKHFANTTDPSPPPRAFLILGANMQDKITIADAPDCLNTNDKAMWVLGYQAAIEARSTCLLQIQEPPTKTETLAHYSQQAILAMDEAAPAAVAVPTCQVPDDCARS